jgi:hypothetical protein
VSASYPDRPLTNHHGEFSVVSGDSELNVPCPDGCTDALVETDVTAPSPGE